MEHLTNHFGNTRGQIWQTGQNPVTFVEYSNDTDRNSYKFFLCSAKLYLLSLLYAVRHTKLYLKRDYHPSFIAANISFNSKQHQLY